MRVAPSLMRRLAAALLLVLLPFGVSGGGAAAQSNQDDVEIIGTITNIAEASWMLRGKSAQNNFERSDL